MTLNQMREAAKPLMEKCKTWAVYQEKGVTWQGKPLVKWGVWVSEGIMSRDVRRFVSESPEEVLNWLRKQKAERENHERARI